MPLVEGYIQTVLISGVKLPCYYSKFFDLDLGWLTFDQKVKQRFVKRK